MSSTQYDDAILDSNAIDPTDKNGNPIPVTIPIMLAPGIKVVYTTRLGGTSEGDFAHFNLGGKSGDKPEHVLDNRKALADVLGAKISLISQVHSGDAVDVDESFVINQPFGFDVSGTKKPEDETDGENNATGNDGEPTVIEADGQVTSRKNVALGMFAADCLPVLMADAEAGVIGAAHCGRRGLQNGVIGATVEKMVAKGAKPERIVATLGPCICGDCYEVGGDIADEFDAQFPGTFTLSRFGQPGIDIIIKPGTHETVYIPACVTKSNVDDLVYNDFYVGENSDVVIVAGCGVHVDGEEDSQHNGIHRFFISKNARVRKSTSALEKAPASALSTRRPTSRWRRTATWRWTPSRSRA